jgi:hypothetical protein
MAKTLFAVSTAALLVSFVAGWAVSDSQASVAKPATVQVNTFKMMTNAKQTPAEHFADYSFVF